MANKEMNKPQQNMHKMKDINVEGKMVSQKEKLKAKLK